MRRTVLALPLALAIVFLAGCARSNKIASVSIDHGGASGLIGMDAMTAAPSSAAYRIALRAGALQKQDDLSLLGTNWQ